MNAYENKSGNLTALLKVHRCIISQTEEFFLKFYILLHHKDVNSDIDNHVERKKGTGWHTDGHMKIYILFKECLENNFRKIELTQVYLSKHGIFNWAALKV
jgi:hypothetical protein